jgi:hypothetical protein
MALRWLCDSRDWIPRETRGNEAESLKRAVTLERPDNLPYGCSDGPASRFLDLRCRLRQQYQIASVPSCGGFKHEILILLYVQKCRGQPLPEERSPKPYWRTLNFTWLTRLPAGVVTVTGPLAAPFGTIAVM